MMYDLRTLRISAYNHQHGRCIYCYNPMWEKAIEKESDALKRLEPLGPEDPREALVVLFSRECTAEHLVQESRGGLTEPTNIAAACRGCNNGRGGYGVEGWREIIQAHQRETQQGTDLVPQLDGTWKSETFLFKWTHILHLEVPPIEVQMKMVSMDGTFRARGLHSLQSSTAVIFPALATSYHPSQASEIWKRRHTLPGTRIGFESQEHAAGIVDHFRDRVISFTNREAA
jgi:hypothetical protein